MAALKEQPWGRHALVITIGMAWLLSSSLWVGTGDFPGTIGIVQLVDPFLLSSVPAWIGWNLLLWPALVAFATRRAEGIAGPVIVAVLFVAGSLESSFIGRHAPALGLVLACNLVTAWELGRWWARGAPEEERDRVGHEAACGLYGAQLTIAALSKLLLTGAGWADGGPLALMIYERSLVSEGPLSAARAWVAWHPETASVGSAYTLLVQLVGFLFLWPRLRKAYILALLPMFLGFALLMSMWEPLWPLMGIALAWSSFGRPAPAAGPQGA